ncbi:MAG: hypothetical protein WC875_02430 [Candidatus Absconditabacterales bacterium]|jgi:hypothetical protein
MDATIFNLMVATVVGTKKSVKISFTSGRNNKGEIVKKGEDFFFLDKKLSPTEILAIQKLS